MGRKGAPGFAVVARRLAVAVLCLAAAVLAALPALAFVPPPITGHVTDAAGKLSDTEREALERKLSTYRSCSTNEIAVFVVPSLRGETIEAVTFTTFNTWKIGLAGKDNGVLLVWAPAERRVRIEVGKGLVAVLPAQRANDILHQHVSPHLKQNEGFLALDEGTTEIGRVLGGCPITPAAAASAAVAPEPPASTSASVPAPVVKREPPPPVRQKPPPPDPSVPMAIMGVVIGLLCMAVAIGQRAGVVSLIPGVLGGGFFTAVGHVVGESHGIWEDRFDLDTVEGIFVVVAFVLVLANVFSWKLRPAPGSSWGGGSSDGSSSSDGSDYDPFGSSSSSSSSFDGGSYGGGGSSGSDGGSYTGGGGSSGGDGSTDSY